MEGLRQVGREKRERRKCLHSSAEVGTEEPALILYASWPQVVQWLKDLDLPLISTGPREGHL